VQFLLIRHSNVVKNALLQTAFSAILPIGVAWLTPTIDLPDLLALFTLRNMLVWQQCIILSRL